MHKKYKIYMSIKNLEFEYSYTVYIYAFLDRHKLTLFQI